MLGQLIKANPVKRSQHEMLFTLFSIQLVVRLCFSFVYPLTYIYICIYVIHKFDRSLSCSLALFFFIACSMYVWLFYYFSSINKNNALNYIWRVFFVPSFFFICFLPSWYRDEEKKLSWQILFLFFLLRLQIWNIFCFWIWWIWLAFH